jgi:hypothetical protein
MIMNRVYALVVATVVSAAHAVSAQPMCPGDFSGDRAVTVDEIVKSTNHALSGCPVRFRDNGDGTISDLWTGLMWEKKGNNGTIHFQGDTYTWSDEFGEESPNGSVFNVFLDSLNFPPGFAGKTDWRLPTLAELQGILDYTRRPSLPGIFDSNCEPGCDHSQCSCTADDYYWSSTSFAANPRGAWAVGGGFGHVVAQDKNVRYWVRAVRNDF